MSLALKGSQENTLRKKKRDEQVPFEAQHTQTRRKTTKKHAPAEKRAFFLFWFQLLNKVIAVTLPPNKLHWFQPIRE